MKIMQLIRTVNSTINDYFISKNGKEFFVVNFLGDRNLRSIVYHTYDSIWNAGAVIKG